MSTLKSMSAPWLSAVARGWGTGLPINLAKAGWENASARAGRADGGLDLARGGPVAAVQHVLLHHAHPQYSVDFYKGHEAENRPEPPASTLWATCGWPRRRTGWTNTCCIPATAETCGVYHEIPLAERDQGPVAARPHRRPEGRPFHPQDGYINPADVTQAMAKGARQFGATIERKWQVDSYRWAAITGKCP